MPLLNLVQVRCLFVLLVHQLLSLRHTTAIVSLLLFSFITAVLCLALKKGDDIMSLLAQLCGKENEDDMNNHENDVAEDNDAAEEV